MRKTLGILAALCFAAAPAARAEDVAEFFRGRQIQLIVGYGPGGGYDLYARLLAKHLGAFVPGSPSIVVQNMPGAGSLRAAGYMQSVAPRDGTVIAALDRQAPLAAVLGGNPAIKYAASDMNWLGTMSSYADDAFVMWVRKDANAKSLDDLRRPGGPELKVGGAAAGSTDDATVVIMRDVAGLNLRLITGYPDGNAISLALERGEVEARMAGVSAVSGTHPDWIKPDGPVRPFMQIGRKTRLAALPDTPMAREVVRDDRGRAIVDAMELPYQLARPYVLAPDVPADRRAALRDAFMKTMNSEAFRKEAASLNMDISPLDGAAVAELVAGMAKAPPEALDYLRKLLTP